MRNLILLLPIVTLLSCNSQTEAKVNILENEPKEHQSIPDCNVALTFINNYNEYSKVASVVNWIEVDSLVTDHFKICYRSILDSAFKADPEMGLGFDPILNAQDSPDKGFEIVNCDNATGYVTVRGKDWPDFVLVLQVIFQDNKWLVDGAGIINIPKDKRAKRE